MGPAHLQLSFLPLSPILNQIEDTWQPTNLMILNKIRQLIEFSHNTIKTPLFFLKAIGL